MAELEANQQGVQAKNSKSVLKTIAKGAKIHGTNGIYFGPDDNLYIASFYGQEVIMMDKESGKILKRIPVDSADDLVFHPDGESFYYTDILTAKVVRMDLEGKVIGQLEVAPGVNPITFSDDEEPRLFVGLDFEGDGLYELDPDLAGIIRVIVPYVPGRSPVLPIGFLNAFDFGPDGFLYGPVFTKGTVVKVDVGEPTDPSYTDPYGEGIIQVINDEFTYPVAAKFGPDGLLTVLDQNGEVSKVRY